YRDYVETIVQRDIRDMARIGDLGIVPKLLEIAAARSSSLLNVSDLAAPFEVSRPTINGYITFLERLFLVERLAPWYSNRLSRLIKTPKVHMTDTGLACALLRLDAAGLLHDRN